MRCNQSSCSTGSGGPAKTTSCTDMIYEQRVSVPGFIHPLTAVNSCCLRHIAYQRQRRLCTPVAVVPPDDAESSFFSGMSNLNLSLHTQRKCATRRREWRESWQC